jgi:hypothetical protein
MLLTWQVLWHHNNTVLIMATSHKNRQHISASAAVCLSTHLCYSFVSSSHDGMLNCYLYDGTCPCLMGIDLEEALLDVIHVVILN